VRRALLAMLAACGPSPHAAAPSEANARTATARTLIEQRCGSCHKPTEGNAELTGDALTAELAVRATDRVGAGAMPQDGSLSIHERDDVVAALCTLAPSSACQPCSAPTYVRGPQAVARVVRRETGVDVRESEFAFQLRTHSPRHALSTKLDATYLLLYTLLGWDACKTATKPDACMAMLLRKENWQLPPPVR
jgi:hypothetical protein